MFNRKEVWSILIVGLVLGICLSVLDVGSFFLNFGLILVVIFINVFTKKIFAYYLDSKIEFNIWSLRQYGFKLHQKFRTPIYLGLLLPLVLVGFSKGLFTWMGCLVFDIEKRTSRAARRHGLYTFSEVTEEHSGLIAFFGILLNLIFAWIFYLIGFSNFASLNLYYAAFNLIPFSDLDGNKIFFGWYALWWLSAILVSIALVIHFMVI